jgi:PPP family 3-phenylpropionic acid transporter
MKQALPPTAEARHHLVFEQRLLVPKVYYFLHFGAMACLAPFLVLYYRSVGLTGAQIGLLSGLSPIVTWLAAPLWGAVADARNRHRELLMLAVAGATVTALLLARTTTLLGLIPVVAAYAFFVAPIIPLVDNGVMRMLGDRADRYGRQRLWGAVGWGITGALAGVLVEHHGLAMSFGGYAVMMALALFAAARLEFGGVSVRQPLWAGLWIIARNGPLVVFLLTVLAAGMGSSLVHGYLFLYLKDLGAPATLMGLTLTVATLSELPIFFYSSWLLRRLGARGMLLMSLAVLALRLAAFSYVPAAWMIVPLQLLHGLTFSAMWVAGVSYANNLAPPGLGATAQGLFSGMSMGLGAAAGALLGGLLYDSMGGALMYRTGALWIALGFLFFVVAGAPRPGRQPQA